jgi:hypothetical protein
MGEAEATGVAVGATGGEGRLIRIVGFAGAGAFSRDMGAGGGAVDGTGGGALRAGAGGGA